MKIEWRETSNYYLLLIFKCISCQHLKPAQSRPQTKMGKDVLLKLFSIADTRESSRSQNRFSLFIMGLENLSSKSLKFTFLVTWFVLGNIQTLMCCDSPTQPPPRSWHPLILLFALVFWLCHAHNFLLYHTQKAAFCDLFEDVCACCPVHWS